jgi:ERCC4-type nuclease
MTIFIDPTESRDNTRLPQAIIESSQVLPGLESLTGADLLISPLSEPVIKSISDPMTLPQKLAMDKHIKSGLLVQRKSGRDLTGSIPKLDDILYRMQQWTHRAWLLIIADIKCDHDSQCIIDGWESGYTWTAVDGALSWWQLRGGMLSILSKDILVAPWVNGWLERLKRIETERFHQVRHIQQNLLASDWKDTLMTFPGIGPEKALALADANGSLAWSLCYLSDEESPGILKIPGIGPETIRLARKRLGLNEGYVLSPVYKDSSEEKTK